MGCIANTQFPGIVGAEFSAGLLVWQPLLLVHGLRIWVRNPKGAAGGFGEEPLACTARSGEQQLSPCRCSFKPLLRVACPGGTRGSHAVLLNGFALDTVPAREIV